MITPEKDQKTTTQTRHTESILIDSASQCLEQNKEKPLEVTIPLRAQEDDQPRIPLCLISGIEDNCLLNQECSFAPPQSNNLSARSTIGVDLADKLLDCGGAKEHS